MASQLQLTGVPADILVNIFSHLDPQALGVCNQTCNEWHQKLQDKEFLVSVIMRNLPNFSFERSSSLQKDYSIQYYSHSNIERGIHVVSTMNAHQCSLSS
jgi:hypothetical protein